MGNEERNRFVKEIVATGMYYFDQMQKASPEEIPELLEEGMRAVREVSVRNRRRPRCPFYGFHGVQGALIDSRGNECALTTDSYSPCQMEVGGKTPYWDVCPLNTPMLREQIAKGEETVRVFLSELRPKDRKTNWNGITFKEWKGHVLKEQLRE